MEALEACECPVCFNEFDEDQYIPLATVCGHTICQNCIRLLEEETSQYTCPLCRNVLQKGSCKVNATLRQLIKELWKLRQTRDGVPLARSPSVLDIPYNDVVLDELIDSGAFGEVYTARWHGNRVAVKLLRGPQVTEKSRASFQREVYVMNCLRHPNIVLLLGACQTPPHLSIVMELLMGGSLHHMIHDKGHILTLKEIQQVALDVACGLQYLHGINILHRDLKGKNVLLTNGQFPCQAKLCDFGLARMRQETATMTGNIGTVHWTAPEIMNNKRYRFSADVYSLGMVLYEMASNKLPFAEMIPMAVMVAVVINKQRPLMDDIKSRHGDEPRLQELIEKCTEWEASERPSITEIISVLTELVPLETSGRRARMVSQQSCDLQSMTIDGLNVVFVAESSSDLTDTTSSVFETSNAPSHNKNINIKDEESTLGAVGGNAFEANDPDMALALQLQREEDEQYRKQIEQDEALARELQHRDFSYRVPLNTSAPKKTPGPELMKSIRNFNPVKLHHGGVPAAPPPPPLPSSIATPTFNIGKASVSNDSPPSDPGSDPYMLQKLQWLKSHRGPTTEAEYTEDSKPSYTNFVTTGSPYIRLTSQSGLTTVTTEAHKNLKKTSASLPAGEKTYLEQQSIPPPPPLPHLPIKRQPSALLREIRDNYSKRLSGHNLGAYNGLRKVETVEKRAFRVGRVIGPIDRITIQEEIKAFNNRNLKRTDFSEPLPVDPVGQVVKPPAVHVPKMKAKFSSATKTSGFASKKRAPGKLKKSALTTPPEDKLPRIPTPPPLPSNNDVAMPTKSKQPISKKSAGFMKRKK